MTNKFILGTAQFGLDYGINNISGKPNLNQVQDILNYAWEKNIRFLDTAESYGNALKIIGKFNKKNPARKFNIITKSNFSEIDSEFKFLEKINKDLNTLNIDSFYGIMYHSFDALIEKPEIFSYLKKLKKDARLKKIGISLYENYHLKSILNHFDFDFIQIPFNLLDNHSKKGELLKAAKLRNIEVHVRSIYLQGLFFKPIELFPEYLVDLKPHVENLKQIAFKNKKDLKSIAIGYPISKEYIDKVIFGIDNIDQLDQNIATIKSLSDFKYDIIDKIDVDSKFLNPSNWNI